MAKAIHEIYIEYDIKGDLSLYDITQALEAINSQYRRRVKSDPNLRQSQPDLLVEEMSKASPFRAKLIPILTQLSIVTTPYIMAHDVLDCVAKDLGILSGDKKSPETQISNADLEDYKKLVRPIIHDQGQSFCFLAKIIQRMSILLRFRGKKQML